MPEFLLGLFIIVVGLRGNAGLLLKEVGEDGSFVPFAVALGIFYWLWFNVPPPEDKATKAIIIGLGGAVVISQASKIVSGTKAAWQALQDLSEGNFTSVFNSLGGSAGITTTGNTSFATGSTPLGSAGFTISGSSLSGLGSSINATAANNLGSSGFNVFGSAGALGSSGTNLATGTSTSLSAPAALNSSGGFGNLTAAQIKEESGGNQFNSSGNPLTSTAGAIGEAQLLPSTAEQVALANNIPFSQTELETNPTYNLTLGSDYMGELLNQFGGNENVALAAYNAGPNNPGVQEFATTGNPDELPAATQQYVLAAGGQL
jgi:hypothetical protein